MNTKHRHTTNKPDKSEFFTKIGILITIGLWITQILVSNQLATAGTELSELEKRIAEIKSVNQTIRQSITEKTSLEYLTEEAAKRGLNQLPRLKQIEVDGS